jgi:hypothetical protein
LCNKKLGAPTVLVERHHKELFDQKIFDWIVGDRVPEARKTKATVEERMQNGKCKAKPSRKYHNERHYVL